MRKSRKGNMPFAIIAVTLLLLSSSYVIVSSQIESSGENGRNVGLELELIGDVMESTERFIEKGLGEIIFSLSTKASSGTVEQRVNSYKERAESWVRFQFPVTSNGVTVHMESFETKLKTESLRLASAGGSDSGAPTYLVGVGKFKARYVSGSGSAVSERSYETDASCALPLIAEQGSLFKNAVSGSGSVLSQMITYQLSALAQHRVLNGYGALAEHGPLGTMSILTEKDVISAYSNAVKVLGLIDFRCAPDNIPGNAGQVDLADLLVAGNGYVEVDISAAYSQALMSVADDVIIQWFDYLMGNVVLNVADKVADGLSNALDSLRGFLSGKNRFSAAPYIEGVLSSNGLSADRYRHLYSGKTFSLTVSEAAIKKIVGKGAKDVPVTSFTASVPYPSVDLMSWGGISDFKRKYRAENNDIKDWLTSVINKAAAEVGSRKAFGTVSVRIDSTDSEEFFGTITNAVRSVLSDRNSSIERIFTGTINSQRVIDPFYVAIYEEIRDNFSKIYCTESFRTHASGCLKSLLVRHISETYGTALNDAALNSAVAGAIGSTAFSGIESEYRAAAAEVLNGFRALKDVGEGQDGLLKTFMKDAVRSKLNILSVFTDIPKRVIGLCEEVGRNLEINSFSGLTKLPGTDRFQLTDGQGRTYVESVRMVYSSSPSITLNDPNSVGDNMHYVGFNDSTGASYCTVFTVNIRDNLRYTASSSGTVESSMGICDAELTDSLAVDLDLRIPVASGWALMGINDYKASNTLLGDAWNLLLKTLEPLLGPLRKIVKMITDALAILNSALLEIAKFAAEVVKHLYEILMEPLEELRQLVETALDAWFADRAESMVKGIEKIIKINTNRQTVGFSFMGFFITFTLNAASLTKNVKTLVKVEMGCTIAGVEVSGSVTVKQKGSGSSKEMILTGGASLRGKDWNVEASVDPSMKGNKHLICLSGTVKGVDIDIVLPELVQYHEIEISICDIPGVGAMLSNIPLPVPGLKAAIDVGLNLKYRAPFRNGLMINEFEQNPEGNDSGREWVELYNASSETFNLKGYTLTAGSNPKTKIHVLGDEKIGPGGRLVVNLPGTFLNNTSSSKLKGGEFVILKDADGNELDKTPKKSDDANDDYTWQRVADGAVEWVFEKGTPDAKNCGGLLTGAMVKTKMFNILKDSAVNTLTAMGTLTTTEGVSEFFRVAMQNAITSAIEMVSDCLVEASIFLSVDITDATGTGGAGFVVSLSVDSDFAEHALKCLIGEVEDLLFNIGNPYGISPMDVLTNDVYLGIKVGAGLRTPKFLGNADAFPEIRLSVNIKANLAGLGRIIGSDAGTWRVIAGIQVEECPTALVPSALGPDRFMNSDLWLIKATFKEHVSK